MKRIVDYIISNDTPTQSITVGDDLSLLTLGGNHIVELSGEPRKLSHAVIVICTSGSCRLKINLKEYEVEAPQLITLMPGQIFEPMGYSSNLDGYAISLSKRFIDMLNLPGWQRQYMAMYNHPVIDIESDKLTAIRFFYTTLYRAAQNTANPFRLQVIENLIRVFYYGGVANFNHDEEGSHIYKNSVVERFIELVQEHYRKERLIGFYADKLCITPKYLSKLVKEHTGRSAGKWIESHTILEARALLHSSDMTIQQIAASLNFPNQSFFGKYFKRATGLSPKQYRQTR